MTKTTATSSSKSNTGANNSDGANTTTSLFTFGLLSTYVAMGRSRIYGLIGDPDAKFPAPIKIGKSSRWLKAEVDKWIDAQAAKRVDLELEVA